MTVHPRASSGAGIGPDGADLVQLTGTWEALQELPQPEGLQI
jgi:hypothetical protein